MYDATHWAYNQLGDIFYDAMKWLSASILMESTVTLNHAPSNGTDKKLYINARLADVISDSRTAVALYTKLSTSYPNSIYTVNARYFLAVHSFDKASHGKAAREFQQIVHEKSSTRWLAAERFLGILAEEESTTSNEVEPAIQGFNPAMHDAYFRIYAASRDSY